MWAQSILYFVAGLVGGLVGMALSRPRLRARRPEALEPLAVDLVGVFVLALAAASAPISDPIFPPQMSYVWRGITFGVLVMLVFMSLSFLARRLWKPPAKR